jgi:nicotinamidase/pyrazinamidase
LLIHPPLALCATRALHSTPCSIPADKAAAADIIVFTDTGRYVGDGAAWAGLCADAYGVSLDLSPSELEAAAKEAAAAADREARQLSVLASLTPRASAGGSSCGKKALIIIDVQNDFCAGGSLAVPDGDAVIPVINRLRATAAWDAVVLTQDWHPADHASFASNNAGAAVFSTVTLPEPMGAQVMWPDHCVQGTLGAEFHPHLARAAGDIVVRKGTVAHVDSYSGFGDGAGHRYERTELEAALKAAGITDVFVTGLALDYCVAFTAKDAAKAGFNAFVVLDACRGIAPDSIARETAAMAALGVHLVPSSDDVPTRDVEEAVAQGALKLPSLREDVPAPLLGKAVGGAAAAVKVGGAGAGPAAGK